MCNCSAVLSGNKEPSKLVLTGGVRLPGLAGQLGSEPNW